VLTSRSESLLVTEVSFAPRSIEKPLRYLQLLLVDDIRSSVHGFWSDLRVSTDSTALRLNVEELARKDVRAALSAQFFWQR
jgi:hypothetical protein